MTRWLELSADYRCNIRCLGCFAVAGDGPSMTPQEAARELSLARTDGADSLWLGGGEPTLRRDLFALVAHARKLGYERVKLQTNGMMLAYPDYVRRLADAGVTEVCVGLRGADAATHDRLSGAPSFELAVQGLENARQAGLRLEADVLVYRDNASQLPDIVRDFRKRGVQHFDVWLFSTADQGSADLSRQVPRISEVVPLLVRAMDENADAPELLRSLHTPGCTVPETHHRALFFAAELDLVVANPGGHRFRLETSPIEGGLFFQRCDACRLRPRCNGMRRDYVRLYGDAEFQPLK